MSNKNRESTELRQDTALKKGQSLKKTIPEELQKKILKIYQKLLLSF
ncbi:MAG: hypothetical protein ACTSRD_15895 [Promethearchaeota archaeon]